MGQSYTANNTLCRYCFQVHPFLAKTYRELPFLAIAPPKKRRPTTSSEGLDVFRFFFKLLIQSRERERCISPVCVCVCVFFPFILDINYVGRTSRGHTGERSHRISHPLSFCGACLNFAREKDSAIPSLVDREVDLVY